MLVSFEKQTDGPWRLFGSSRVARLIQKKSPLTQCSTCWDFHSEANCDRFPVCKRCGDKDHYTNDCQETDPKCVNCLAVHEADFDKCLARPRRIDRDLEEAHEEREGQGQAGRGWAVSLA